MVIRIPTLYCRLQAGVHIPARMQEKNMICRRVACMGKKRKLHDFLARTAITLLPSHFFQLADRRRRNPIRCRISQFSSDIADVNGLTSSSASAATDRCRPPPRIRPKNPRLSRLARRRRSESSRRPLPEGPSSYAGDVYTAAQGLASKPSMMDGSDLVHVLI